MTTIFEVPTEYDEHGNYYSKIIVCPRCQTPCNEEYAKVVSEPLSDIVLGFLLHCTHCRKRSFIGMVGKPPLFDLSGRYMFVGKEG